MILQGDLTGFYYLILLTGLIIIIITLRIRHILLDIHRSRLGLIQFFTLSWQREVGPRGKGEGMAA